LAKKHFFRALEINPEYSLAYYELAHHSEQNGDLNEAKIHFQKATDIEQNFVEAYFHLARICTNPSEYDQAFRNYETALEIEPNMAECHYWFGKLLTSGEKLKNDGTLVFEADPERAEVHFRKAIKINPKYSKAFFKLGLLLKDLKRYNEAYENLEKSILINPKLAEGHYHLAVLLMDENAQKAIIRETQKKPSLSKARGTTKRSPKRMVKPAAKRKS
jgi:tetratricopeptide (TPR) repeat protein